MSREQLQVGLVKRQNEEGKSFVCVSCSTLPQSPVSTAVHSQWRRPWKLWEPYVCKKVKKKKGKFVSFKWGNSLTDDRKNQHRATAQMQERGFFVIWLANGTLREPRAWRARNSCLWPLTGSSTGILEHYSIGATVRILSTNKIKSELGVTCSFRLVYSVLFSFLGIYHLCLAMKVLVMHLQKNSRRGKPIYRFVGDFYTNEGKTLKNKSAQLKIEQW